MANYRSLVGGFFANPDKDTDLPASIRYNNPGAINAVAWVQSSPGYVHSVVIKGNNPIAVFETPEQGVALWYNLLVKYRKSGAVTLNQIITRYGGGQDYSAYVQTVAAWAELAPDALIDLEEDDETLLAFANAMFRYEAGKPSPLTDKQILYGFELARGNAPEEKPASRYLDWLTELFAAFGNLWHKPQPKSKPTTEPSWLTLARKDIGFHETGDNQGLDKFLKLAKTGNNGDPWCAIFVNAKLEESGTPGTRSAMARSFEKNANFVKLSGPAMGAISTFWRGSPTSGSGHVNFYVGTDSQGRNLGLGGNQSDQVDIAVMDMSRHTGWWWPKGVDLPKIGQVTINIASSQAGKES